MPQRIVINRNEPVPLSLTADERRVLLDDLSLDVDLAKAIRNAKPGKPAFLPLEDMNELADQVTDEAKRPAGMKLKKTLGRIVDRIDEILDSYVEFIPRPSARPNKAMGQKPTFKVVDPVCVSKIFDGDWAVFDRGT
jgi:hypothetical protein